MAADDHQHQGHPAFEKPVELVGGHQGQGIAEDSVRGVKDKKPDDPRDRRGDPESPEDGGAVKAQAPDFLVRQNGQKEGKRKTQESYTRGEDKRMKNAAVIFGGGEELPEIFQAHKDLPVSEGGDLEEGEPKGFKSRPEEKDEDHDQLRRDQQIGEQAVGKDALFHTAT